MSSPSPHLSVRREHPFQVSILLVCLTFLLCIFILSPGQGGTTPAGTDTPGARQLYSLFARVQGISDSLERRKAVADFLRATTPTGCPLIDDSTVTFVYEGPGTSVAVAGDMNDWNPSTGEMKRLQGTRFFYRTFSIDPAGRSEYKLVVDASWILDPRNPRTVMGGLGLNSELRMPAYVPPPSVVPAPGIFPGRIDTLLFRSVLLACAHPAMVYTPASYAASADTLPVLFVMDGGEYLALTEMRGTLDYLIGAKRITPVVVVFLDPRTDIRSPESSRRMAEYALNDTFIQAVVSELRPMIGSRYRIAMDAARTAIMGVSMGGLIATYAGLTRPDIFGLCAAQSPSYWWEKRRLVRFIAIARTMPLKMYIDTGTLYDVQEEARAARDAFLARHAALHYEEHPEGHNWLNWRSRIPSILSYFWGTQ